MLKCTFEDGGESHHGLRHIVTDCIVVKDNQLLLVKRALNLTNGGKWALPGGYVNFDESVEDAALRELREESGYDGEVVKFLGMFDSPKRKGDDLKRQNVALVYLVNATKKVGKPDDETIEINFFDTDKLPHEKEFAFDHFKMVQYYLRDKGAD